MSGGAVDVPLGGSSPARQRVQVGVGLRHGVANHGNHAVPVRTEHQFEARQPIDHGFDKRLRALAGVGQLRERREGPGAAQRHGVGRVEPSLDLRCHARGDNGPQAHPRRDLRRQAGIELQDGFLAIGGRMVPHKWRQLREVRDVTGIQLRGAVQAVHGRFRIEAHRDVVVARVAHPSHQRGERGAGFPDAPLARDEHGSFVCADRRRVKQLRP